MYCYLIGWSTLNVFYYGVRYSKTAKPIDLWESYFTSSKYVSKFVEEHGDPDIVEIRKEFDCKERALRWESTVLRRMNVVSDERFLNRWDNNMIPHNHDGSYPFENAAIQAKVNETLIKQYGARGSASSEIKDKVFKTNKRRYGVHHTLSQPNVKNAREESCMQKYGEINPFFSRDFQESLENPMHNETHRQTHKIAMQEKDWSERNEKNRQWSMQTHGVSCVLNTPENIEKRKRMKRSCPYGCKDNHKFDKGNFTKHMKQFHEWSREQCKEYHENQENST